MSDFVYAIGITVNGVTCWQVGTWPTITEAAAYLEKHDEFFGDIEIDLAKEHTEGGSMYDVPEVETIITYINTPKGLGWGAEA